MDVDDGVVRLEQLLSRSRAAVAGREVVDEAHGVLLERDGRAARGNQCDAPLHVALHELAQRFASGRQVVGL